LTKEYRSGDKQMVALSGMNLDAMDGEFLSLLGPSGCGKSTALNIMGGLLTGDVGHGDLRRQADVGPSRDIGMMFQQAVMFPWRTTIDNVLLPIEVFGQSKKKYRAKARNCSRWWNRRVREVLPVATVRWHAAARRTVPVLIHSPNCCCSTSRSAPSTNSPVSR